MSTQRVITHPYRHWTPLDIVFIRQNYGKMLPKELAEHFDVSIGTLRRIFKENNIHRPLGLPRNWKQWQVDLLEKEYETTPDLKGLAQRIGKSVNAIRTIAYLYALQRPRGRKKNEGNG